MNYEIINIVYLIIIIYALIVCIDSLKESKFGLNDFEYKLCIRISIIMLLIGMFKFLIGIFKCYTDKLIIANILFLLACLVLLLWIGKKIQNPYRRSTIIIYKLILILNITALTYKIITLISNKSNLSADIVTLITVIVAFLTAVYTTMKSNKADLSAESLWRKELMNVASKKEIGIDDLLRLRASQNYKYINKPNGASKPEKSYISIGYEVRDKIGTATNDLYNKYISTKSNELKIRSEDQNTIRNLSIALLKYDYIKRGDNVKLTHYIIRELEEDNEYQNLLNWIDKEVENRNSKLNT